MLVESIEFKGIKDLIDNMPYYRDKFLKDAVFCLRNANLTVESQEEVARIFGDYLQWSPNSKDLSQDLYIENHSRHMKQLVSIKPELNILPWHMEHIFRKNPIVSGLWNMEIFTCDNNFGKTYFVDMAKLFNQLSKEDQDFLIKVKVTEKEKTEDLFVDFVQKHRITEENVIRFPFPSHHDAQIFEFDGKACDKDVIDKYEELHSLIINKIMNDETIRFEQLWQQGDLIVVDLFKMAHAVTGGFMPDQRKFTGIFGAQYAWDSE